MRNLSLVVLAILLVIGVTYKGSLKRSESLNDLKSAESSKTTLLEKSNETVPPSVSQESTQSTKTTEVAPAQANCYAYEYRHKKDALNKDIEEFLDFSNAFSIQHHQINSKSLCVKVNQKAVAFQLKKNKGVNEVVLGPIVGPESLIRISYCTGQATCKEPCAQPKKRFMDDLEANSNDDAFQDSWGKDDDQNKKELNAKAKELRKLASENSNLDSHETIREWDTLSRNEWTCKEK